MTKTTWSAVATVDEPPALVQAWVAWHLALGAKEVFVYFDRPDDPAADLIEGTPRVHVTRCDAAYWEAKGRRPDPHQSRQLRNGTDAFHRTQAAWLLHLDADEYLWCESDLAQELSEQEVEVDFVRLRNVERIYRAGEAAPTIFGDAFRKPLKGQPERGAELFGPDFLMTSRGLTGHSVGKSITRVRGDRKIAIHKPRGQNKAETEALVRSFSSSTTLLHFDGLTPLNWIYKLLRKAHSISDEGGIAASPHRQKQLDAVVAKAHDPATATDLHDRLKVVDETRMSELLWLGLTYEVPFDVTAALAEVFPRQDIDLSPAAIDAWLWAQKGDLMRRYGLDG